MCEGRTTHVIPTTITCTTYETMQSMVYKHAEPKSESSSSTTSNCDDEDVVMESWMDEDMQLEVLCAVSGCENFNTNVDVEDDARTSDRETLQMTESRDLEEIAVNVLSPTALSDQSMGKIVVDYDEDVPDQSRATLLLEPADDSDKNSLTSDCIPSACQPVGMHDIRSTDMSLSERPLSSRRKGKSVVITNPESDLLTHPSVFKSIGKNDPTTSSNTPERCSSVLKLCLCEVRLHVTMESCWLVANKSVYDVTGMIKGHPGGIRSILRKAGGVDCTEDMQFHSKGARKSLEKCFIGRLQLCGESDVKSSSDGSGVPCCIM